MIDHTNEELIPFETAGLHIPGRPDRSTCYRWWLKGVRGAKLETLLIGNKRYTSREAIDRFIADQNRGESPEPQLSTGQRRRQSEAARKSLEQMGIALNPARPN